MDLTIYDPILKQRIPWKCVLTYDFDLTLDTNIKKMMKVICYEGMAEYTLCFERFSQMKSWEPDTVKRSSLLDMNFVKEEHLPKILIQWELYYMVPMHMLKEGWVRNISSQSYSTSS